jgi:hypothetical protein
MPWTRRQFLYLLSKSSPLTEAQKARMLAERKRNPGLIKRKV